MANTEVLFRPFTLKTLELKNRIVMAPMTRSFAPEGIPGDDIAAYYRRRAEGEVGLILSEGTVVDRPGSRNHPGIPFFHGERALNGWQKVINEVHAAGAKWGRRYGTSVRHRIPVWSGKRITSKARPVCSRRR